MNLIYRRFRNSFSCKYPATYVCMCVLQFIHSAFICSCVCSWFMFGYQAFSLNFYIPTKLELHPERLFYKNGQSLNALHF